MNPPLYEFSDGKRRLAVAVVSEGECQLVRIRLEAEAPCILHWGLCRRSGGDWVAPPEDCRPLQTSPFDSHAARTPFPNPPNQNGIVELALSIPRPLEWDEMAFVLHFPTENLWLKDGARDFRIPLSGRDSPVQAEVSALLERIVSAEMGQGSWTLMHRFNLCHDMLESAQDSDDALALLFAWLRYSALRQLAWQRKYNTQPRELSHAQDRLTRRLAAAWRRAPCAELRLWPRLMLTTLGRGGDGQRVRDEILQIMHRNHIRESSGHFLEEWHQKLHNNTTPDDIAICQAFLAFLRSGGGLEIFYHTLANGGVTRERLRSFERAIVSDPSQYPGMDKLIGEFENFLRILKSVHSGTDLESALASVRKRLEQHDELRQQLERLMAEGQHTAAPAAIVSARASLARRIRATAAKADDAFLRDLLCLDLALEQALRLLIERQNLSQLGRDPLVEWVRIVLDNIVLSLAGAHGAENEFAICARHWSKLSASARDECDWALHAGSVADRMARAVQEFSSHIYDRLQPKAELLGEAFHAEPWIVRAFSEEIVRGGPVFALSLLLRHLSPLLRREAGLGAWQIVSPARNEITGRVKVVPDLSSVQNERFTENTVLVAGVVHGNEDIPPGVAAFITADAPDLVSHVAVRARNARVLFAACFERELFDALKQMDGQVAVLRVTPGGDVQYSSSANAPPLRPSHQPAVSGGAPVAPSRTGASAAGAPPNSGNGGNPWALSASEFTPQSVGGKSLNLHALRGRLPDWIRIPPSIALPFGAFERTLEFEGNRCVRERCGELLRAVLPSPPWGEGGASAPGEGTAEETLARVREALLDLTPHPGFQDALAEKWRRACFAGAPEVPWERSWAAIKRVWASQWNERAYYSRRARGADHGALRMAVLIQQVVEADCAFVIHTANPQNSSRDELYAEVVLGLGETLVGNHPGRALGAVCVKSDLRLRLLSYPGKSAGLYGRGVIFRSDSNGEDLEDFAGAGLYDSVLAEPPHSRTLDYSSERLVWDEAFRSELLRSIARLGLEVEKACGSPQDIEGAVSGGDYFLLQTRAQVGLCV